MNQEPETLQINESKPKKNKALLIYVIIMTIIAVFLSTFIVYDKFLNKDQKNNIMASKEKTKEENDKTTETKILNQEELNIFLQLFNEPEVNAFLTTSYNSYKEINPDKIMYNLGTDKSLSIEEANAFLNQNNYGYTILSLDDLKTKIKKITKKDLTDYFKEYTDKDLTNNIKTWTYIKDYEAYYNLQRETSYIKILECHQGFINEQGEYVITSKLNNNSQIIETTLEKKGKKYIFKSNKCLEHCDTFDESK